ncbi:MAG: hypothetical protein WDW38_009398 [Sanguina aurantia]
MRCAAVQPNMPSMGVVPRLDLITQINEIDRSYCCRRGGRRRGAPIPMPPLADGGADLEHFTAFVMHHVLGHLSQRGYRLPTQKWDVAGVCFQHLHIMLLLGAGSGLPASDAARQPPGHHVIRDLLGGGPALQALLYILGPGFADLTSVRTQVDLVTSREAAVLAALRVLHTALTMDLDFVADLSRVNMHDRHQPLHVRLAQPSTLVTLLQYVCYSDSIDIQVASLQLMSILSQRLPNIVEILIQAAPDLTAAVDIQRGVASALRQGLAHAQAIDSVEELRGAGEFLAHLQPYDVHITAGGDAQRLCTRSKEQSSRQHRAPLHVLPWPPVPLPPPPLPPPVPLPWNLQLAALQDPCSDPRASLILQLLMDSCSSPGAGPGRATLCQLLMGYEVEADQGGVSGCSLAPHREYSCLTVVERALVTGGVSLSQSKPRLYSQMLSLLYRLACHLTSGGPMLDWLSPNCTDVVRGMRPILLGPLPSHEQPQDLAASLRQRASILQIQALLLLKLEHPDSLCDLLSDFFATVDPSSSAPASGSNNMDSESSGSPNRSVALDLLELSCCCLQPPACRQLHEVGGDERRLWQDMAVAEVSVESLLSDPRVMAAAGVQLRAEGGELQLYDIGALYPLLRERYEVYVARTGGALARAGSTGPDPAAAAITSALQFATSYNAHTLVSSAQRALVQAWVRVVEVSFCLRYPQLASVLLGCQAECLHELLLRCLQVCKQLLSLPDGPLPQLLANASRLLLSKLQEQAVVQLLELLAGVTVASRRTLEVRVQLYAAMLQYLQYCRGSKLCNSPRVVLASILEGWGSSPSALADLDTTQESIEQGNASILAEHGPALVALIAVDALNVSSPALQQAVALHLVGALVAADARVGVAAAAHAHGVPQQLLQLLASVPQAAVIQHSRKARRAMYVIEAQLSLLLRLTEAGPVRQRTASAQKVQALQAIPILGACRALDLEPESIHGNNLTSSSDSLRSRLPHVIAPTLRLLLSVLASLPESAAVRNDAAGFVLLHYRVLERLLREAGSSATATWSPGPQELEQAELAVQLLCKLVPCFATAELPVEVSDPLLLAVYQLLQVFGTLSPASSSPLVAFAFGGGIGGGRYGRAASQRQLTNGGRYSMGGDTDMAGASENGNGTGALALTDGRSGNASGEENGLTVTSSSRDHSAARQAVASSILALRLGLITFLSDLAMLGGEGGSASKQGKGEPRLLLRAVGTGSSPLLDPTTSRPTLMLVRDMSHQAVADAAAALDDLAVSLRRLRQPQQPAAAGAPAALQRTLQRAGAADRQLGRALSVLETGLSVTVLHFLRCVPRPSGGGAVQGTLVRVGAGAGTPNRGGVSSTAWLEDALGGNGNGSGGAGAGFNPTAEDAAKLGNRQELAFLRSRLQDTVLCVEDLLGQELSGLGEHSLGGVDLLARTLKGYVMME